MEHTHGLRGDPRKLKCLMVCDLLWRVERGRLIPVLLSSCDDPHASRRLHGLRVFSQRQVLLLLMSLLLLILLLESLLLLILLLLLNLLLLVLLLLLLIEMLVRWRRVYR